MNTNSDLADKSASQLKQASTPCIDDHQLHKKILKSLVNVLRFVRTDLTLWGHSQHCRQSSTRAEQSVRLKKDWRDCHVGDQIANCTLGLLQVASFAVDFQLLMAHSAHLVIEQTCQFHGSTQSKQQFRTTTRRLK